VTLDQIQELEGRVGDLNVSSLVVEIGGLGATYPTFVVDNASLRFTIDSAIEEWVHQYLAFRPLGFRYVLDLLGVSRSYEITTINETVASSVSQELGQLVYNKYYASYNSYFSQYGGSTGSSKPATGFDFNAAMREIRVQVDKYLAAGQTNEAERYMDQQREMLASKGHFIRRLNQAYFAFYGSYANSPTSVDPIGAEVAQLRNQSLSIKAFLESAAELTCRNDLVKQLKR
jgi:hypothetical protein